MNFQFSTNVALAYNVPRVCVGRIINEKLK
jgi:hypothetical protein